MTKATITDQTVREVETLIVTVRLYNTSRLPFMHRKLKALLGELEGELQGQKHLKVVQHYLQLIRDEITIR